MGPIDYVGLSRTELYDQVRGPVWRRWCLAEPHLAELQGLEELWRRRGRDADRLLGALVRMAACDAGDDQLATIAVCHQLAGKSRQVAINLRDLSPDVDEIVAGALWLEIKTFPWRKHTRGHATWLVWQTRASVLRLLLPTRGRTGGEREIAVDPLALQNPWSYQQAEGPGERESASSETELHALLEWALVQGHLSEPDVALLRDLVAAGVALAESETPRSRNGVCSQAAIQMVASQRGVCGKTVVRHRDRAVQALQAASSQYLSEAA